MTREGRAARGDVLRDPVEYGPKYPGALMMLEKDADVLLTFFDFPAEHWKHLRTSNVVEPPVAMVRLRQRVTKGAGSRTKGLLRPTSSWPWRRCAGGDLDGAHHLPLVRADSPRETRAADRWRVGRTVPSIILSPA